jgi:hypothetical protein
MIDNPHAEGRVKSVDCAGGAEDERRCGHQEVCQDLQQKEDGGEGAAVAGGYLPLLKKVLLRNLSSSASLAPQLFGWRLSCLGGASAVWVAPQLFGWRFSNLSDNSTA